MERDAIKSLERMVTVGDKVKVEMSDQDGSFEKFFIISNSENLPYNRLMPNTPFAQMLLGKRVGDTFNYKVNPNYSQNVVIKGISKASVL